jgi:hypothetical protein
VAFVVFVAVVAVTPFTASVNRTDSILGLVAHSIAVAYLTIDALVADILDPYPIPSLTATFVNHMGTIPFHQTLGYQEDIRADRNDLVVDIDLEEVEDGLAISEDHSPKAITARNTIPIDTCLIHHMVVLAISTKDIPDRNTIAIDTYLIDHILIICHFEQGHNLTAYFKDYNLLVLVVTSLIDHNRIPTNYEKLNQAYTYHDCDESIQYREDC